LEARELDACGPVLIARSRVDHDWFYHRSFDHGATWRSIRLGPIGAEGQSALVRCIGEHGGVEAGRAPLPTHWSWDGGHTWSPAGYDVAARRLAAHLAAEDPTRDAHEDRDPRTPRCEQVSEGEIGCMDPGRLRLVHPGRSVVQEVRAPSTCPYVRQTDPGHTYAFGPGCGLYVSTDRGGVWRMLSQSLAGRAPGAYANGRGGFVDARTAWRLDGGIWWTFDGGQRWRPYVDVSERVLDRGVFIDTQRGVFATAGAWVVATHDGGRNWTYVLRGDVERIASSGRSVVVTTTQTVRVTPNGGVTWLAANAIAPQMAFDPSVELVGDRHVLSLGHGARVTQQGGRIALERDGDDAEIVHGLPPGYRLLAAHAAAGGPDRLLLEGGVMLARQQIAADARRGSAGGGGSEGRHRRHRRRG
jgi:hypothetical protein